jgi:hypothetical protein
MQVAPQGLEPALVAQDDRRDGQVDRDGSTASVTVQGGSPDHASTTTGMIIGRRRCVLDTQRPTTLRMVCCSW